MNKRNGFFLGLWLALVLPLLPAYAGGVGQIEGVVLQFLVKKGILSASGTFSGVSGSLGSTDNAVIRADGTGGATAQGSSVLIGDSGDVVAPAAGGVVVGGATTSGARLEVNGGVLTVREGDDSADAPLQCSDLTIQTSLTFTADLGLARDAAGVLRVSDGSTGVGSLKARAGYEVHASDDTLTATESGSLFSNSGAATRTLTLPTVAVAGVRFSFVALVSAQVLRIDPGADEKFIGIAGGWADGEYMELDLNESVEVVSQADGDWVVTYTRGTPAEQTP